MFKHFVIVLILALCFATDVEARGRRRACCQCCQRYACPPCSTEAATALRLRTITNAPSCIEIGVLIGVGYSLHNKCDHCAMMRATYLDGSHQDFRIEQNATVDVNRIDVTDMTEMPCS
jgi:hypothetical protein